MYELYDEKYISELCFLMTQQTQTSEGDIDGE